MLTKKKIALTAIVCIALCAVSFAVYRFVAPSQTQKATDSAVVSAEKMVASADKAIRKTYETAQRKVVFENVAIQERVENLDGHVVADELIALLGEYRRERDGANRD